MKEKCQDCMCTLFYVLSVFFFLLRKIFTHFALWVNASLMSCKCGRQAQTWSRFPLSTFSGVLNQELVGTKPRWGQACSSSFPLSGKNRECIPQRWSCWSSRGAFGSWLQMAACQVLPCWPCPPSKLCHQCEHGFPLSGFNPEPPAERTLTKS